MALVIAFVSALTKGETPLTVIQLLWVNLIMDALGALGRPQLMPACLFMHVWLRLRPELLTWANMTSKMQNKRLLLNMHVCLDPTPNTSTPDHVCLRLAMKLAQAMLLPHISMYLCPEPLKSCAMRVISVSAVARAAVKSSSTAPAPFWLLVTRTAR